MAATDTHGDPAPLPTLPAGWRHASVVERVAREPRERRETILAGAFALAAALWAPLGVLAFLTRNGLLFGLVSVGVAVVVVAPRPATSSVSSALEGVGPALASLREHAATVLDGLRGVARRVAPHLQAMTRRIATRVRAADQRISAAVRSGLEDLRASGGGDHRTHRTPSSAR